MIKEFNFFNGDCLSVMDELIKSGHNYDFVFTSPPYNRIRNDKYAEYDDTKVNYFEFLCEVIDRCLELSTYTFFNIQQTFFNKTDVLRVMGKYAEQMCNVIVWEKENPQPNNNVHSVVNSYEFIFVLSKTKLTAEAKLLFTKNHLSTPVYSNNPYSKTHNAVMNPLVVDWFLEHFTEKGDSVLDCFMGVGTTGERCKALDRNFTGIELSKKYFDTAVKRIKNFDVQERMF